MDETSGTLDKRHQSFFLFLQSFSSILIDISNHTIESKFKKKKYFARYLYPCRKLTEKE